MVLVALRIGSVLPALTRRTAGQIRAMATGPAMFDGEIAKMYEKLFEQHGQARGPWVKMLKAVDEAMPSGEGALLDLATGPGEPANLLARAMPKSRVVATDVSGDMLEKARQRMVGLGNVEFAQVDMQVSALYMRSRVNRHRTQTRHHQNTRTRTDWRA